MFEMHFQKEGFHVERELWGCFPWDSETQGTSKTEKEGRQRVLGLIPTNPRGDLGKPNLAWVISLGAGWKKMSSKARLYQRGGSHEVPPSSGKGSRNARPLPSLLEQAQRYRCQCLSQDAHTHSRRGGQRGARPDFVWPGLTLGLVLSGTRARSPWGLSRRSSDNAPWIALFRPAQPWAARLYLRPQGRKSRKQLKVFLSPLPTPFSDGLEGTWGD